MDQEQQCALLTLESEPLIQNLQDVLTVLPVLLLGRPLTVTVTELTVPEVLLVDIVVWPEMPELHPLRFCLILVREPTPM
jgi:hypothetical protein